MTRFHKDAISNSHLINCSVTSLGVKAQYLKQKARTRYLASQEEDDYGQFTKKFSPFILLFCELFLLSTVLAFTVREIALSQVSLCCNCSGQQTKKHAVMLIIWKKTPSIWNPKFNKTPPSWRIGTWAMATFFYPGTLPGHSSTVNGVAEPVDSTVTLMYDPVTAISTKRWGDTDSIYWNCRGRTVWGRHSSMYCLTL